MIVTLLLYSTIFLENAKKSIKKEITSAHPSAAERRSPRGSTDPYSTLRL